MQYIILIAAYIAAVPVLAAVGTSVGYWIAGRLPASWSGDEQ